MSFVHSVHLLRGVLLNWATPFHVWVAQVQSHSVRTMQVFSIDRDSALFAHMMHCRHTLLVSAYAVRQMFAPCVRVYLKACFFSLVRSYVRFIVAMGLKAQFYQVQY